MAEEDRTVEEEIPVLDASMLHSLVDFETGMSWWPPVTLILTVACIIVFACEVATGALHIPGRLLQMGALSSPHVQQGELWRMLSATFLHADPEHLVSNLLILLILGMACEHAFGSSQFLFLYVVVAVGGSCASLFNDKISVGASGAIFGMAGLLIAMFRRHRDILHARDRRIGFVIGIWAIYQIVSGCLNPQIDNLAHAGGFATGLVLGWFVPPIILHDREEFSRRPSVTVMLLLGLIPLTATSYYFIPRLIG